MSLFISRNKKASITVEASIVLPIFLFAVISLLSMIDIIRFQSNMEAAIHQTGKKMAVYAYAYDKIVSSDSKILDLIESIGFSSFYVKEQVEKELGEGYIEASPVKGGKKDISFLLSKIMEDDMIDIIASYQVRPTVSIIKVSSMKMVNRCRMRAWTGYDNTRSLTQGSLGEPMVYVTETGIVYHMNRNCTHLSLSIKAATPKEIEQKRNEAGGKYYACERCGKEQGGSVRYITGQGNRFHTSLHCSGLKRTISIIPLSKALGKTPCERCRGS